MTKQEEVTPSGEQPKFTRGPWIVWRLAPDSDSRERVIVTTADGETEVCGIVERESDARLIAASPELYAALKRMDALVEGLWKSIPWGQTFNLDIAALNEAPLAAKRALALVDGPQETK